MDDQHLITWRTSISLTHFIQVYTRRKTGISQPVSDLARQSFRQLYPSQLSGVQSTVWGRFASSSRQSRKEVTNLRCSASEPRLSSFKARLKPRHFSEHLCSFFTLCQKSGVEDTSCQLFVIAGTEVTYTSVNKKLEGIKKLSKNDVAKESAAIEFNLAFNWKTSYRPCRPVG